MRLAVMVLFASPRRPTPSSNLPASQPRNTGSRSPAIWPPAPPTARDLPSNFLLQLVESATDYSPVKIGDGSYLLPTHSETIICTCDPANCFKNESTFRNYRKFETNTSIIFGK